MMTMVLLSYVDNNLSTTLSRQKLRRQDILSTDVSAVALSQDSRFLTGNRCHDILAKLVRHIHRWVNR